MRKKGLFVAFVAVTVLATSVVNMTNVHANRSLEQRIESIQQERSQTEQKAKQRENELTNIKQQRKQIEEDIAKIDQQMMATNKEIQKQQNEITKVEDHIEQLKEEILIIEKRIKERDELLKERARSMYQNGGSVSYLEVLLGAKSFGDFIDRINALSVIAEKDRSILEAHIEDQQRLEAAKQEVEKELASLEQSLAKLEQLKGQLESQKKEKDRIVESLLAQEEDIHDLIGELKNEAQILAQQERAMKQELVAYKARQRANQSGSGGSAPIVTGNGKLLRPTSGIITSHFGNRVHPIHGTTRLHRGLDIANSVGTPVVAAESGTVITASYEPGYGNYIMISHNIDGQVMTTLYAHLNSIQVSTGQRVNRGQQIGTMGSTGASTGPHLHFEVHRGPWSGDANAVNPLAYIQ